MTLIDTLVEKTKKAMTAGANAASSGFRSTHESRAPSPHREDGTGSTTPTLDEIEHGLDVVTVGDLLAPPPGGNTSSSILAAQQRAQLAHTSDHYAPVAPAAEEADPALTRRGRHTRLEDLEIRQTLGTGSFGRVHLVREKDTGKYFAMKVLKKTEVVKHKQVEHTLNEKHILEQLQHPFLVNLHSSFQDASRLYIVMDYITGGELFTYLRRSQRFSNNVAKFYAGEVLLAFEYLHKRDIIYRDLKPENLLLDGQGHIKIIDFGFAKYVPDVTWTLCGTPDYLAPEIIQSRGYGKAVDWYALGVLIFEMLAGYPPFYDEDTIRMYQKILQGRVKWPSHFDPAARDLLKRLLTADLTKRYGNLKGGSKDIKTHRWFANLDWGKLYRKQIPPPYVPLNRGDGDTSNFDVYPEETEPYGRPGPDPYAHLFKDF
ncbi:AGC/PKA protein kinase [Allomyces macrogynus ATCC 38327]|uniref:cAMP-dependent protein kinase n=1 Tax=Allomyces macrogynus (strain ATCC 38327) TaxID=578462 RepID=A0A0L0SAZ8_ALLM3|nr:AGC/PKA protein kinase [Allomyces macrogynus ATCC 38327]|eukprot:KNE59666.1 AGC/PKA protein kinase [Allomyces macrogynus ATCC 38327]